MDMPVLKGRNSMATFHNHIYSPDMTVMHQRVNIEVGGDQCWVWNTLPGMSAFLSF